jgi:penicillin amidase
LVKRFLQILLVLFLVAILAIVAIGFWARAQLNASLPQLEGQIRLPGLTAAVEITRDRLGIPTVRGATREDVARATGFLHAQDRFFQMDLARRRAAGELAALVGPRALALDREIRIHRFRNEAAQATTLLSPTDRAILDAYAAGVNTLLTSLTAPPFEYLVLRQQPQPWRPEDSMLVVLSMFITLQDTDGSYEATLATMHDILPEAMYEFLAPRGTGWDTPLIGGPFEIPAIPGPEIYDLRARRGAKPTPDLRRRQEVVWQRWQLPTPNSQLPKGVAASWELGVGDWEFTPADREAAAVGSNNWAVSGRLTADGGALVANDMHLSIRVPNTWYRAELTWPDPSDRSEIHRLIGVTLPGVPALVVGSNTHVAWGFTNTYADWSDIVLLEIDPTNPNRYRTPEGWRDFDAYDEVIRIAGQPDQDTQVRWTVWGPVLGPDHSGRPRAYRWVAYSAERLAASVTPLESSKTIEEAIEAANGLGTPGQNLVVADRSGRIGWSVYGSLPRRRGLNGQLPASWADGTRGWSGWLEDNEYPRIVDPPGGRLWTANNRVVDGEMLAKLGDGSYEIGSRAHIIRQRLMSKNQFTPRDLLDIQLDTRADFLARWRDVILRTLTSEATAARRERATFREIVDRGWTGRASPDSAAYRLTRAFRETVSERIMAFVLSDCYEADPTFDYTNVRRRDEPIWKLVTAQPLHLLDPRYSTWDQLLLDSIDTVIDDTMKEGSSDLNARVWSDYNVTMYRHPLSAGLPLVGRWLDMPRRPLPGDLYTPRVQWGSIGASERMVVSPGRESEGIMHMPTGQSGHPLSPFYSNSHDAWVNGEATSFLPGPPLHRLALKP